MARKSPAQKLAAIRKVIDAWERIAPDDSFYGFTLASFKAFAQPSLEARDEIDDLQKSTRIAIKRREASDSRVMRKLRGVVYGVQGDPKHTQDGELYEAMGYVRKSARRKRGRRAKR